MQQGAAWTASLATFVVETKIEWTAPLLKAANEGISDWFTSTLSAHDDAVAEQLLTALGYSANELCSIQQTSTIIGKPYKLPTLDAALINGYLAHALDYDDVHEDVRGHPSAVLLSALFAEAEAKGHRGNALLEGYVIGMEVMCRLGKLAGKRHYELGWHSTATLGAIAAATAVARMCSFTVPQTVQAIGIAATQSGGLRVHFGSMVKPLHAGFAARAGLLAARMSAAGIIGTEEALAGSIGYFALITQESQSQISLDCSQWTSWSIIEPGLWYKKYPCCSAAYHAIDAAHDIWLKRPLSVAEITSITLTYPTGGDTALIHRNPKNGIEGKFSAEYIVALKLIESELSFEHFSSTPIKQDILELINKSTREYRDDIVPSEQAMPKGRYTQIQVKLNTGEVLQAYCECPTGSPAKPMSDEDHRFKLEQAVKHAAGKWRLIYDRLSTIQQCENITLLFNA